MSFSRSTVIKSLIWKLLERGSVQVVTFVVTIVLARILVPEDYGLIALVLVFINISNVIVDGGLNMALVQKKDADNVDFSTIFYTSLLLATILYLVLYFFSGAIAEFYGRPELVPVIKVLGVSLFFYAITSIQKAFLSRNLLFKNLFYSSLGAVVISGVLGIWMAKMGYGVWALVVQNLSVQVITAIIMWFTVKWRPQIVFSYERFKGLFNFGWKIFASNFLINLFINVRSLIIGKVYTASALGYFDRGKQFPALIIENINASIQAVLFPVLSGEQDNVQVVKAMVRRSIKMSAFIIFPLVIGLVVTAEPLIYALLTEKWMGAVPFIQIFSFAYMLMPMQIANLQAIQALGHSGTTLKIELIKKVIELLILIITVSISVLAIAWGIVAFNIICLFINVVPNKKLLNYGIKEQVKDVIRIFLIALTMGGSIYWIKFLNIPVIAVLFLQFIVGVAIYMGLCLLFKEDSFMYLIQMYKDNKHKLRKQ